VLAAVRVIVREWAKRTGAPDGLTTAFIKQARACRDSTDCMPTAPECRSLCNTCPEQRRRRRWRPLQTSKSNESRG
jgi:hypothetical protein